MRANGKLRRFVRNRRAICSLVVLLLVYCASLVPSLFCKYSPHEVMNPDDFRKWTVTKVADVKEASAVRIDVSEDMVVSRVTGASGSLGECVKVGMSLDEVLKSDAALRGAISSRFANSDTEAFSAELPLADGTRANVSLTKFSQRDEAPRTVRIRITECGGEGAVSYHVEKGNGVVSWPFRPVPGHFMGIDAAGRDVFARVLHGTRTAMTFGMVLVIWSMVIGVVVGAVQGYFGGWVDLGGQRFIEIWSSLPFLYIMILVGSVFGRSFGMLLFCYGLFNWIGISYYARAEFLRLRDRPFVDAARCQGLGTMRIMLRHILPNALTPLISLLPFNLVGAIASISALDFLGFGLPPLSPSWGELLQQAQQNVSAWWLTLYPSLMLFLVMLLTVFVGEGVRDAFDPKPNNRYR